MRRLILVVGLLTLTSCGTVRSLAGPDPTFAAATPGIAAALRRDSIAHPEFKAQNDAAIEAMEAATRPGLPPPPKDPTNTTDWLLWGITSAIGLFTGGKTINRIAKKRKAAKATPGVANTPA